MTIVGYGIHVVGVRAGKNGTSYLSVIIYDYDVPGEYQLAMNEYHATQRFIAINPHINPGTDIHVGGMLVT